MKHVKRCINCDSWRIGNIHVNWYYCRDCYVEFEPRTGAMLINDEYGNQIRIDGKVR